jgi:pimeloyl-ACP methyl ester carboxylesterase
LKLTFAAAGGGSAVWALRHFRSRAVEAWTAPNLTGNRFGPLYARTGGDGDRAVVLLHGLVSTGDVFGGAYDQLASTGRVVIPDLLGFGRSMDETRSSFSVEDHMDALDQLAERTGLFDCRWTIGAHSMGSALALHWAGRHVDRVDRVVCWGAPLYASADAAIAQISGSTMARLFVLDTRWAERACAVSCRHRSVAGWFAAAFAPALPIPIARAASLHTWPAYRDAMSHFVVETDWHRLLNGFDDSDIHVELVWGTSDKVGDHDHGKALADIYLRTTVTLVEGADHGLPMTHPQLCLRELNRARDTPRG